jgi:ribonuclease-3
VAALPKRSDLEERVGVTFKDKGLLQQALVHSSYVNENPETAPESNERLEFLGDAVLGLVVADELYAAYPDRDEGKLTELRTLLVRRDTLAKAARRLKLGEVLLLGRGEEVGGGRGRSSNLSHAYEAVVGSIFLDRGLATARRFVCKSLNPEFEQLDGRAFPLDPKSRLQEASQSLFQTTPVYRLVEAEGPDHARRFTIEVLIDGRKRGSGKGPSKQQAEKEAAREALKRLEKRLKSSEKKGP